MKKAIAFSVALLLLLGVALVPGMDVAGSAGLAQAEEGLAQPDEVIEDSVEASLMNLPLYFIENQGQMDQRVAYYVQGRDKSLYFTSRGVTFLLSGPGEEADSRQQYSIKLEFVGADPDVQPVGKDRTEAIISYFKGSPKEWKTGLPTYAGITYPDLWPGIDLVYSGDASLLKYTFLVQPGVDPGQIRLAYDGASAVTLNGAGQLEVITPAGGFLDERPVAFQDAGGQRVPVESSYALDEEAHSYGFQVGSYDPDRPLVIDPAVLVYCGYIGGSGMDSGSGIAVDGSGSAYVIGSTSSGNTTFPVAVGPYLTHNGGWDAFVAKVNAGGTGLDYCGYIGGNESDWGEGIAVDGSGCAYVTGSTSSGNTTFPVTVGPYTTYNGSGDAFVAKVNAGGTGLDYCGYIGGSSSDFGQGIAVDDSGNAYVTGSTWSGNTTFPVTVGPNLIYNGSGDAFVAKVKANPNDSIRVNNFDYCGYIGGSAREEGNGIAVDGSGSSYVIGITFSDNTTFPVTVGPDLTYTGNRDTFVAKVRANPNDSITVNNFNYCGYIGGSAADDIRGIAVDGSGCAYVTGSTNSTQTSFPVTMGPDLTFNGGGLDAFVAKVKANPNDSIRVNNFDYCGYIGGSGGDLGFGIAVDGSGYAYVTGFTQSDEAAEGFPATGGPDLTYNGLDDAFVAKVKPNPNDIIPVNNFNYCGYIGGSGMDEGMGIAVDESGCAYVTGFADYFGITQDFPVTVGPDLTFNGITDAFVAKVCETEPMPVGGVIVPVDKIGILAPLLGLAALIIVAITTAVFIRRRAA